MGSPFSFDRMYRYSDLWGDKPEEDFVSLTPEQKRKKQEEEFAKLYEDQNPVSGALSRYADEFGDYISDPDTPTGMALGGLHKGLEGIGTGVNKATSAIAGVPEQPFSETIGAALYPEKSPLDIEEEKSHEVYPLTRGGTPNTHPIEPTSLEKTLATKGIQAGTDPTQLAFMAGGPVGAIAGAMLAPGMIKHGGEEIGKGWSDIEGGELDQGVGKIGGGLFDVGMGGLGLKHPIEAGGEALSEAFPAQLQRPVRWAQDPNALYHTGAEFLTPENLRTDTNIHVNKGRPVPKFEGKVTEFTPGELNAPEVFDPGLQWNPERLLRQEGIFTPEDIQILKARRNEISNQHEQAREALIADMEAGKIDDGEYADKWNELSSSETDAHEATVPELLQSKGYDPALVYKNLFEIEGMGEQDLFNEKAKSIFGPINDRATARRIETDTGERRVPANLASDIPPESAQYLETSYNVLDPTILGEGKPLPYPPLYMKEFLGLEGTPSSERGALDLGSEGLKKLNAFEDSQYRKYGADWRAKQDKFERIYHESLINKRELESAPPPDLPVEEPPQEALSAEPLPPDVKSPIGREELAKVIDPDTAQRVLELVKEGHPLDRATRIARAESQEMEMGPESLSPEDLEILMAADVQAHGEAPVDISKLTSVDEATPGGERIPEPGIEAVPVVEPLPGTDEPMQAEPIRRGRPAKAKPGKVMKAEPLSEEMAPEPERPEILESDTFSQAWAKMGPSERLRAPLDILKSLRASIDTPVLRQGKNFTLDMVFNDPRALWESLKTMKNQAFSESEFKEAQKGLENDPIIKAGVDRFGLDLPGVGKALKEEAFHGGITEKIPVIKHIVRPSDRAYTSFLNAARAWKFNDIASKLKEAGYDIENPNHAKAFEEAAKAVNIAGSRGHFSRSTATTLNNLSGALWSPRNRASKFQLLWEYGKARTGAGEQLHPVVAKELTKGVERVTAVNLALLGLAAASGSAYVSTDPTNTDFLRAKIGNTVWDPWFGLQPIVRGVARSLSGSQTSGTGRTSRTDPAKEFGNYVASGLAPGPNLLIEQLTGATAAGYEKDRLQSALESVSPMVVTNLYDQLKDAGVFNGSFEPGKLGGVGAGLGLNFMGETVDTRGTGARKGAEEVGSSVRKTKKGRKSKYGSLL